MTEEEIEYFPEELRERYLASLRRQLKATEKVKKYYEKTGSIGREFAKLQQAIIDHNNILYEMSAYQDKILASNKE